MDIKSQQLRLPLEPQEGCLTCFAKGKIMIVFVVSMYSLEHIDVEAGLSLMNSTISKTGMGVTSRP